jgi:hypothetical protein
VIKLPFRTAFLRASVAFAMAVAPAIAVAQQAGCDSSIASAQDTSRLNFISGRSILAGQSFSQKPSSFKDMTCLEKLFSFGNQSMDILFQPPSMSSLLSLIQNFACQAMSQYIGQAGGGFQNLLNQSFGGLAGGINGGSSLGGGGAGQIIPGVNIGSIMTGTLNGLVMQGNNNFNTVGLNPMALFPQQTGANLVPQQTQTIGQLYGGLH